MDTEKLRFAFKGSPNLGRAVYKVVSLEAPNKHSLAIEKGEDSVPAALNITYNSERNSSCSNSQNRVNLGKGFRILKENDLIYIDFKHGFSITSPL